MSVWSDMGIEVDEEGNVNMAGVNHCTFLNAVYGFFSAIKMMGFHGKRDIYENAHENNIHHIAARLIENADFAAVPKGSQSGFRPHPESYKAYYDIRDLASPPSGLETGTLHPLLWSGVLMAKPLFHDDIDGYQYLRTGHPIPLKYWEDPDFDPEEIEKLTDDAFLHDDEENENEEGEEKEKAVYIATNSVYERYRDKISAWSQKQFDIKWAVQRYKVIQRTRYVFLPMTVEYSYGSDDGWTDWRLENAPPFYDNSYILPFTYNGKWHEAARYRFNLAPYFRGKMHAKLCVRMNKVNEDDDDYMLPVVGSHFIEDLPYILNRATDESPEIKLQVFMLGDLTTYEPFKKYFDVLPKQQ